LRIGRSQKRKVLDEVPLLSSSFERQAASPSDQPVGSMGLFLRGRGPDDGQVFATGAGVAHIVSRDSGAHDWRGKVVVVHQIQQSMRSSTARSAAL
jgi:hypothetical protein